jgi:IS30 family transposase
VRHISPRFLSQDERIEIADLRHAGLSIRQIAHRLGRAASTVSRELRRNATRNRGYRPFDAHRRATARRTRNHRRRIESNGELRQLVAELLTQRWSPQQISRHLRLKFPEQSGMWLCHESIYPGRLSAGMGTAAAIAAGSAPSLPAAHRARSPPRSSAHRMASGKV